MTPRDARTNKQVRLLNSDNYDNAEGWIIVDGWDVTLCTQRICNDSTGKVTFSRRRFNELIDWYQREQRVKGKA